MSGKGGAGKVYFILYLAVLLELLIIIVERDDAEEELRKEKLALEQKTKRIQLIAETIINSLRSSATSVSSTSDQTYVMGDEKEANGREFNVRVRVSDPIRDSVRELDLHILRNDAEMATINLANDPVQFPRERNGQDYTFKYNFKPGYGEGKYTLRFDAKTNQIVGVTPQASPDDTVKIGAVHLTVKELKEVKDGITENIALRGYIDSLLNGQYENFATNIGTNEFTVNVKKKEAKVTDQLTIFPQEQDFASFPGLELPNPVKIEGATIGGPQGVTVSKMDGPGDIRKIDSTYYWVWKPDAGAVGQTYTVKLKGHANRGGGAKDDAVTSFTVSVKKLELANAAPYWPGKALNGTPYTSIVFKANEKFANLDGIYRTELYLNGSKIKESNEPTIEYEPEFMKDEGKSIQVKAYYKSNFMKDYVQIDEKSFKIAAPPFIAASNTGGEVTAGDAMEIKAAYNLLAPVAGNKLGQYKEVGADHLDIQSDGYFEGTAKKMPGNDGVVFQAHATSKAQAVKNKDGKTVDVTVTDPVTGQTKNVQVTIMPKVASGRGGAVGPRGGGGGGIH
jgi:hypothetical protein